MGTRHILSAYPCVIVTLNHRLVMHGDLGDNSGGTEH